MATSPGQMRNCCGTWWQSIRQNRAWMCWISVRVTCPQHSRPPELGKASKQKLATAALTTGQVVMQLLSIQSQGPGHQGRHLQQMVQIRSQTRCVPSVGCGTRIPHARSWSCSFTPCTRKGQALSTLPPCQPGHRMTGKKTEGCGYGGVASRIGSGDPQRELAL